MGDFFHGWRRKTGLSTLVLALVVLGLWMRSHGVNDLVNFRSGQENLQVFVSDRVGFVWMSLHYPGGVTQFEERYQRLTASPAGIVNDLVVAKWSIQCCGFGFGSGEEKMSGWGGSSEVGVDMMLPVKTSFEATRIVIIPNWSVVLTLTLISTGLLLPRWSSGFSLSASQEIQATTKTSHDQDLYHSEYKTG